MRVFHKILQLSDVRLIAIQKESGKTVRALLLDMLKIVTSVRLQ